MNENTRMYISCIIYMSLCYLAVTRSSIYLLPFLILILSFWFLQGSLLQAYAAIYFKDAQSGTRLIILNIYDLLNEYCNEYYKNAREYQRKKTS